MKTDADLREALGRRALELVRLRHDARLVAEKLRRLLRRPTLPLTCPQTIA